MSEDEFAFFINCHHSKPLRDCVLDDKTEMLECLILHFTHYRIRTELDQLKQGFANVWVLPAIQHRPNLWKLLLCTDKGLDITAEYIRKLFVPSFAVIGSNARCLEEDVIYHWEEYLKEMGKTTSPN